MASSRNKSRKTKATKARKQDQPRQDPFLALWQQLGDAHAWWPKGRTPLEWMLGAVIAIARDLDSNTRFIRDDLEDIAILTLSQLWEKRHEIEFPRAWCRTVARRHLLDELDQMPVHLEELVEEGSLAEGPWGTVAFPQPSDEFVLWFKNDILPQLSPALRPIAECVFVEELDYDLVATQLNIESGTLRVYVGRARDAIRVIAMKAVVSAIEGLDPRTREVVRLYLLPPYDPPWEIANYAEMSEDEIWSAVRKGVRSLRRDLGHIARLWPRLWESLEGNEG